MRYWISLLLKVHDYLFMRTVVCAVYCVKCIPIEYLVRLLRAHTHADGEWGGGGGPALQWFFAVCGPGGVDACCVARVIFSLPCIRHTLLWLWTDGQGPWSWTILRSVFGEIGLNYGKTLAATVVLAGSLAALPQPLKF